MEVGTGLNHKRPRTWLLWFSPLFLAKRQISLYGCLHLLAQLCDRSAIERNHVVGVDDRAVKGIDVGIEAKMPRYSLYAIMVSFLRFPEISVHL